MPVVRTQRLFIKNQSGQVFCQHIFGNELIIGGDEDSMEVSLLQATIPPVALHLSVYYSIGLNTYVANIPIELMEYATINALENYINARLTEYAITGFLTLNNYLSVSSSGGKLRFTSAILLPTDPYVYQIEIDNLTMEQLIGLPIGIHTFPNVAPNRIDALHKPYLNIDPPAVYLHTDLNSTYKNLDNIETPSVFVKSDLFAKCPYENPTGGAFTYFYDSTKAFMLNVKTETLSQLNFFLTDLNRTVLIPQRDWNMVIEITYRKKPDYNDVIQNNLLTQMRDYLRNMWLSSPPAPLRKAL